MTTPEGVRERTAIGFVLSVAGAVLLVSQGPGGPELGLLLVLVGLLLMGAGRPLVNQHHREQGIHE